VAAVEEVRLAGYSCPVVIEGETPPHDPRLNQFSVTPILA
jgi:uncharacterized protein (DUF2126 family)